jgi:GNAT superfamily N-acetyltransferase
MELTEVTTRLAEPRLLDVLQPSVGFPTPEKLAAIAETYAEEDSWSAYALFDDAAVVGIIGFELTSPGCLRIRHIAVPPIAQRRGLGRRLIEACRERVLPKELYAETDKDAVQFYERCGFTVESLGEQYPGVERFACRWRAA